MTDENSLPRGSSASQPRGGSRTSQQGAGDEDQDLDAERSVAEAPATGDARVDDAVAGLSRLRGRPADEHVAVLEEVHGRLRDILGEVAEEQAPPRQERS
jgi:hypothetical protein